MRIVAYGVLLAVSCFACSGHSNDPAPVDPGTDSGDQDTGDDTISTTGFDFAQDVTITEVAIFQGVKVPLMKDGAKVATRKAQVVANREGIFRIYVTPGPSWTAKGVVAEVVLKSSAGDRRLTVSKTLVSASKEESQDSTFNVEIPPDTIQTDTTYSVALKVGPGTGGSAPDGAVYPAGDATDSIDAQSTGEALKIVLVPVKYNADGSGRLPDTSDAQVEIYKRMMYAMYPVKKQPEITVRDPYSYSGVISRTGSGWSQILQRITDLRGSDGAPADTYYYGLFEPASTFMGFCSGACVSGLSWSGGSGGGPDYKTSVGLGYPGEEAASTMQHEVGHAHGRLHAPCGPGISGIDPGFPYSGGKTGGVGYDITTKKLVPVEGDIMSYCPPAWISDYTYNAIFKRVQLVSGAQLSFPDYKGPQKYRIVNVDGSGAISWGDEMTMTFPPMGEEHTVTYTKSDGTTAKVTGVYAGYDHLPGGMLLVPEPKGYVKATIAGFGTLLARKTP